MSLPVGVLGAGSFGTCLAILCASQDHDVTLWAREREVIAAIERDRRNPRYLSDMAIPRRVRATHDLAEALAGRELVILAVPSHGVRDVMAKASAHLRPGALLVSTVKGIEEGTGYTMDRVLEEVLPPVHHPRLTFLSGPSFAREVAERRPTVVTVACHEEPFAIAVQTSLSCPWFRCYSHTDVLGVQLGGALKNVIALAVGVCDGLAVGANARAALMTRGLAEVTRLGVRMGARPLTFQGLSGMGDLVLTCTGDLSRNRQVGLALGRGQKLAEIVGGMDQVAEGVRTTRAACALAARYEVEMPIASMVQDVLDGTLGPGEALLRLMTRQLRSEHE